MPTDDTWDSVEIKIHRIISLCIREMINGERESKKQAMTRKKTNKTETRDNGNCFCLIKYLFSHYFVKNTI